MHNPINDLCLVGAIVGRNQSDSLNTLIQVIRSLLGKGKQKALKNKDRWLRK